MKEGEYPSVILLIDTGRMNKYDEVIAQKPQGE
jgi:hypothetical protein